MKKTSPHPDWALACKRPGTELRFINGRYYLYEVSSKWNPEKKRSMKITGKLLGSITEADGFVESEKGRLRKQQLQVECMQVKEYGIPSAIDALFDDTVGALRQHFPDLWQRVLCLAYGRLVHRSPLKNMAFHYSGSFLSEQYSGVNLSLKSIGYFLQKLGGDRQRILSFCSSFGMSEDCILFYSTIPNLVPRNHVPLNLMFLFSVRLQAPVYYRLLPGNARDINVLKQCYRESGVKDAVIVMDSGFTQQGNFEVMEKNGIKFIVALERNNPLINYKKIQYGDKRYFDGYFKHGERYIWHYTITIDGKNSVTVFLDDELRSREQKDYLNRIENKALNYSALEYSILDYSALDYSVMDYSAEKFSEKLYRLGTVAIMKNIGKPPGNVFANYTTQGEVKTVIDKFVNIAEADRIFIQNEQALEGWMFINMIALKWYYSILNLLKKKELDKEYSPMDLLLSLSELKKVKINNQWYDAEITKNTRRLLQSLNILPIA